MGDKSRKGKAKGKAKEADEDDDSNGGVSMVVVMTGNSSLEVEDAIFEAIKQSTASFTSNSNQGLYVWKVRNFITLKNLLQKRNITGLAIKSGLFEVEDHKFCLVVYPRGNSQPPIHLSVFIEKDNKEDSSTEDSCFSSFHLSVVKRGVNYSGRKVSGKKGSGRKGSTSKGSANTRSPQSRYVTKDLHGRIFNADKALGWANFLDLQTLFDPTCGFLVDSTITFHAKVVILEEQLLRGNDEVRNAGFSLDKLGEGEFFLWSVENFSCSPFLDILKADEIVSPWFRCGALKIRMVIFIRDGTVGAKLRRDLSAMDDSIKHIGQRPRLGVVQQESFRDVVGEDYFFGTDLLSEDSLDNAVWLLKLSKMLYDGYVVDGSALFMCHFKPEHPRYELPTEVPETSEVTSSENEHDIFGSILKRADSSVSQPIEKVFLMDADWIQSTMNEVCLYLDSIEAKDFLSAARNSFGCDLDRVADSSSSLMNFVKDFQQLIIDLLLNLLVGCCEAEYVRKPEDYDIPEKAVGHPPSETSGVVLKMKPFQDLKINWPKQPQKLSGVIINSLKALDVTVPQDCLKPKQWPASVERITHVMDRVSKQLKLFLVPLVPKLVEHSEHPVAAALLLRQVTKANPELELLQEVFSAIHELDSSSSEVWECVFSHSPLLLAELNDEPLATTIEFLFNAASHDSHHQHISEVVRNVRVRLCGLGVVVSPSILELLRRIVDTRDDITKAWLRDVESSATGMMDNEYPHFSDVFIFIEMLSRVKDENQSIRHESNDLKSREAEFRKEKVELEQKIRQLHLEREANLNTSKGLEKLNGILSEKLKKSADKHSAEIKNLEDESKLREGQFRKEKVEFEKRIKQLLQEREENLNNSKGLEKVNNDLSKKLKKSALKYADEIKKLKVEKQSIEDEGVHLKLRVGQLEKEKVEREQKIEEFLEDLNNSKGLEKVNDNLSEELKRSALKYADEIKKLKDEKQSIEDDLLMSFYTPLYGFSIEDLTLQELESVERIVLIGLHQVNNALAARRPPGNP